jgi:hypothetical protein
VAAVPRAGWLALTVAMAASMALHSHSGGALVLLAAGFVPVVLSPGDGPTWPLAAAAPAVGGLGLTVAWPALAGLAGRARRRAALGATGWLWIALWHQGFASNATVRDAVHHVLGPLLTAGTLSCSGAWALAALVLPWTRTRRSPQLEYVRLAAWATALALATVATSRLGSASSAVPVGPAFAGAYAGALVALVTRRFAGRLRGHQNRERSSADRVASH